MFNPYRQLYQEIVYIDISSFLNEGIDAGLSRKQANKYAFDCINEILMQSNINHSYYELIWNLILTWK